MQFPFKDPSLDKQGLFSGSEVICCLIQRPLDNLSGNIEATSFSFPDVEILNTEQGW